MSVSLRPMFDRVLLRRKEAETKSHGGLFIPSAAQEKSNLGEVVAVGPGRLNADTGDLTPLKVEVGMTVLIGKWQGDEIKIDEEDLLIIREADILAVVD